jgi:hypothetical protein
MKWRAASTADFQRKADSRSEEARVYERRGNVGAVAQQVDELRIWKHLRNLVHVPHIEWSLVSPPKDFRFADPPMVAVEVVY